jgi:hypothetical protein
MRETRELREQLGDLLDRFAKGSSGWTARISQVQLARAYASAGRSVPQDLRRFL